MKWSKEEKENSFREAYLRTLLLHVYAQMFEEHHIPQSLKWSYPSSMDTPRLRDYQLVMSGLADVNPIVGDSRKELQVTNFDNSDSSFGSPAPSLMGSPSNLSTDGGNGGWNLGTEPQADGGGWDLSTEPQGFKKRADVELSLPQEFDTQTIEEGVCLTESAAVANYVRNATDARIQSGVLTLTFDVGGSTTDLSVLTAIEGSDVLLKQSSIRFAAQRVSQATSYSPRFKQVLLRVCGELNIKIQGLNAGEDKYTQKTAPFYFEQLVDQLDDEKDFRRLYSAIATECPELMAVNLYVTGLILYYAGQLTKALADWLRTDPKTSGEWANRKLQVPFAGKGSRIFDWHRFIDPTNAEKYLKTHFVEGMGGASVAGAYINNPFHPKFAQEMQLKWRSNDRDVKYEVSKGLAMPVKELLVVKSNVVEIIGEDGFKAWNGGKMHELDSWSTITPSMYEHIGKSFVHEPKDTARPYPRFITFAERFYATVSKEFDFPVSQQEFVDGLRSMSMDAYVQGLPDYNEALQGKDGKFQFVQPMIILCGMNFLQNALLPNIQKNVN